MKTELVDAGMSKQSSEGNIRGLAVSVASFFVIYWTFSAFLLALHLIKNPYEQRQREFEEFEVLNIPDAGSLHVRWVETSSTQTRTPAEPTVHLAGIWSDKAVEPQTTYAGRLHSLLALKGRRIRLSIRTDLIGGPNVGYVVVKRVANPAEVILEDGTHFNEQLLRSGQAIIDTRHALFRNEERQYYSAQTDAMSAMRGLWGSEEIARVYRDAATRLKPAPEFEPPHLAGLSKYIGAQVALFVLGAVLAYLCRNDSLMRTPAVFLLVLPLVFTLPYVMIGVVPSLKTSIGIPYRFEERAGLTDSDFFWGLFYLSFGALVILWVASLAKLLRNGPLGEWRTLWVDARVRNAATIFFMGFCTIAVVFIPIFLFVGPVENLTSACRCSLGTLFGLSIDPLIANDSAFVNLATAEKTSLAIWLLLCGALQPRPSPGRKLESSSSGVIAITLASLIAAALVLATVFGGIFWALGASNDVSTCFWFSLAVLFRTPYAGLASTSANIQVAQSLEALIALIVSLIGFRATLAAVQHHYATR